MAQGFSVREVLDAGGPRVGHETLDHRIAGAAPGDPPQLVAAARPDPRRRSAGRPGTQDLAGIVATALAWEKGSCANRWPDGTIGSMTTIRPQSLSGLLSAALLLIVLPLTAALVYGGVQLRQLSRTSDVLVRDSIALTQHTQVLFQNIAAMERAANLYRVLNDPRARHGLRFELRSLQPHARASSPTTCRSPTSPRYARLATPRRQPGPRRPPPSARLDPS